MVQVVRTAPSPAACGETVDRYLGSAGVAASSRRIYRISLTTWVGLLADEPLPGRRRGARAPDVALAVLDDPAPPTTFGERAASADTVNRELSALERCARPDVDAVGAYVARRDPAARRRHAGVRSGV